MERNALIIKKNGKSGDFCRPIFSSGPGKLGPMRMCFLLILIPCQKSQCARRTVIVRMGEKYARVANVCQAVEVTLIARRRKIAKMAPVSTFANLPTPVGPMPCARAPSTGRSVLALQIILETQRLNAFLTKIIVKLIPVEKMQYAR